MSSRIRPIDPQAQWEIDLVARRMRATLVEVLGPRRGKAMYTLAWLRARVRFHLDPKAATGAVFVSEGRAGGISGHTIVRMEGAHGLFATTFVTPRARRHGIASDLLRRGEAWMCDRGLTRAATYTAASNAKLIALYRKHGYRLTPVEAEMVMLERCLRSPSKP